MGQDQDLLQAHSHSELGRQIGSMKSSRLVKSVIDLVGLDPIGAAFCGTLSALCVYGVLVDLGPLGTRQELCVVLLIGACAKLMLSARTQFAKRNVPWTAESRSRERWLVVAAALLFLAVCWVTAIVVTQVVAFTLASLLDAVMLTSAIAFGVGALVMLGTRASW